MISSKVAIGERVSQIRANAEEDDHVIEVRPRNSVGRFCVTTLRARSDQPRLEQNLLRQGKQAGNPSRLSFGSLRSALMPEDFEEREWQIRLDAYPPFHGRDDKHSFVSDMIT
jgi:hypothetical protein